MATLDVQPKKKAVWPWILLLLILVIAGVVWYMMRDNNTMNDSTVAPATGTTSGAGGQPTQ